MMATRAEPAVGVVIPYYQREPGILERALRSVAAQESVGDVRVVVIDDSSPVPARSELAQLTKTFPFALDVIVQSNAGPGAARNRGIRALKDVGYVAFLDSDDEWCEDHLSRAISALGRGFDVFFADFYQPGVEVTAFRRAGRIDPQAHPPVGAGNFHAYVGDMFDQVLTGNVIGTSTVVYDRRRFPDVFFRTEYRNAGEDYLFWIDLARAGARFVFSATTQVRYGFGVNIYAGAGWGTETHFLRLHNEMKYRKTILREFPLSSAQRSKTRHDVTDLRRAMARDLLHRLMHRKPVPGEWTLAHARLDPLTYALLPWNSVRVLAERALRRANGPR